MKFRSAGVLLLAALTLASCGTRLPDSAFRAQTQRVTTNGGSSNNDQGDTTGDLGSLTDNPTDTTSPGDSTGSGTTKTGTGSTKTGTGSSADSGPNKASDVGVTETFNQLTQIRHRDPLGSADVYPSNQRDVFRHGFRSTPGTTADA